MENFTKRIEKILESKNITASEFSKIIDVPRSVVSHVLNHRNKPSLDFIIKISKAFDDISLDYLINGVDSDKDPSPIPSLNNSKSKKNDHNAKEIKKIVFFYSDESFKIFKK
tara:strand:- start:233 stop:568 length:336 start_codon:yes stop_codon:yes gene_type:complete